MVRAPLLLISLALLQGCGLTDRFFNTNECEGDNCEAPVLLDNSNSERKWYCYGKSPDEWQCQNSEDPNLISAIEPKSSGKAPAKVRPSQEAQPQARAVTPEPPQSVREPETQTIASQILSSPSEHYAVQLIALRELEGIFEYARLNGIAEPKFVKIRNEDSDWYILLLGVYSDRTLAEAAKREWQTAKVLRVQPWVRQLGGLQDAIRKARG